ncbi:MAG: alpha-glucosidase/alpha-galactosidase, partial [Clostridia bacterium]|nr:alpha-glucosidase/alpha-galactosidase [Clostridia bacterium]
HLAEFMDFEDYLENNEDWMFSLTPVSWRKEDLGKRLRKSQQLLSGERTWTLRDTGEEGTLQIRALLGLSTMVTNINIPNRGQISNLPIGTIVETNAAFRDGSLQPVLAGAVPESIYPMISRAAAENDAMLDAAFSLDLSYACEKFCMLNLLKRLTRAEKEALFHEMVEGTKAYLTDYL